MAAPGRYVPKVNIPRLVWLRRVDHEWTQAQLAEAAGLSVRTIEKIEQGRGQPSIETLSRLARALGVERTELLLPYQPPAGGQ